MKKNYKDALFQTWLGFKTNVPILMGVILLIVIIKQYIGFGFLANISHKFIAVLGVNILGSISAGNPINSYIIASEIGAFETHVLIIAVFLISWITVGVVQIPAESYYFGKKYSLLRNTLAFLFALVAGSTVYFLYYLF